MNRRKLLSTLAGWLAIPALAVAQTDGPRFTSQPSPPRIGVPAPTHLPEPIAPVAKDVPLDARPKQPAPAAEIVVPKKVDPKPAVSVEELPYDPRPYNQRWMGRPDSVSIEDGAQPATNFSFAPDPNALVWVVPEWILWKTSGMHVPTLVTSAPFGAAQSDAGVIGTGSTSVAFGNESQLNEFRSGVRVRLGFWFDPTQTLGLEGSMFYLGQKSRAAEFTNSGNPTTLARPFMSQTTALRSSEVIAFAQQNADGSISSAISGGIVARTTTDFWGADINLRRYLFETESLRVDGLFGFRYQRLRDTLETNSNSTINVANTLGDLAAGTTLQVQDMFHTTTNFYGGQFGVAADWRRDRWSVGLNGKLAIGMVQDEVRINGLTTITPSGGTSVVTVGGLMTQASNIGRHRTSRFSVIPEAGLNVGFQLTSNVRLFAGYSVLYWTNVVRAGDQIDMTVNTTQVQRSTTTTATLSGDGRPGYGAAFREAGFWAHGGSLGLEFRW